MDWLNENWPTLFGGVGTATIAALLTYILRKKPNSKEEIPYRQKAEAGENSNIIQGARDVSASINTNGDKND